MAAKINPQSTLFSVRLAKGQKRKLVALVKRKGLTMQAFAREMVTAAIEAEAVPAAK
jgi:hypothetical protein